MAHGPKDITLNFFIGAVKLLKKRLHFFALGIVGAGACVNKFRKFLLSCEFSNQLLIGESQWSNNRKFVLKKSLGRHHGADFTGITYVHEKCFNDIILVMPEGQFRAAEFIGNFKQAFSSQSGAKKAGVFTIFGAMRHDSIVRVLGSNGKPIFFTVPFQRLSKTALITWIDINWKQYVADGHAFKTLA